ncbi:LysR family transcriptional regulator [Klebsiella pneumoniae]|uniref:LysR family transcriptional regulator n=1 Tax=Klebsiella pneumoniae TaxID=573 RepID=UPI000E2CFFC4|nr:LysR family transcriptional regulator [Klebsiella pneumoniae]MBZ7611834.1 LysR family transcriptional regulator [Klebsiella pneumoniae]SVO95594.1 LysR family transcriptional regulator [Klebsiella pneumoniae]SWH78748.1 LysR family transcriptional regulator [Klebsiella pneumoniae]SWS33360.1 LysR family transcriptional regulator [Klebsiella pneumoniae]SWS34013.1 LysR family transcriptional regulator [Klebsiella pneumoniae]
MFRLEDLTLFVRAAALGSFSDAAREAGQQPAQVSAAIKRLETILNIRLFARSTRSLRLTPEGETWLPYATQMLDTLEAGLQKIQTPDDEVRGMLQIAVPSDLGRNLLLTLFRDFRQRHPALRLRLLFSDQLTDVFKDPVDVAFRYGNNDDASFISLPVAPENRRVLVASPEWIARHGEPQTLEELSQHNALIYILRGRPFDRWSLSLDGVVQQQKVSGTVMSDDAEVIRRLAIAGEGIAYKSMLDVSGDLRAGRLRRLLPRYQGDVVPLNLICPHRKQLSAAVRLLYEEVKSHCEGLNA